MKHSNLFMGFPFILLCLLFYSCKKEVKKSGISESKIKYFTGTDRDKISAIKKTSDGGFIYCGYTTHDSLNTDGFLMKVDSSGEEEWYKSYGGKLYDIFNDVIQCADGGFIAVGATNTYSKGAATGKRETADYTVRTNAFGEMIWFKSYSFELEILMSVVEMPDKTILITGYTYGNDWNISLFKLQNDGSYIYRKSVTNIPTLPPFNISNTWGEFGTFINMAKDGSLIIGGVMDKSNNSSEVGHHITFTMFADPSKGKINSIYPYYNYERNNSYWYNITPYRLPTVKILNKMDGYLLGTYLELPGAIKIQLLKLGMDGSPKWEKEYQGLGNSLLYEMEACADGGTLLVGMSSASPLNFNFPEGFSNIKIMLLKVDSNGTELWKEYLGSSDNVNAARAIQHAANGGWIVAGITCINENGFDKMFVLKVDEQGKIK